MSETALTTEIKTELVLLESKRSELTELADIASKIPSIKGIDDKEGIKAVNEMKNKLVKARTAIEAERKEYTKQFDIKKNAALELEKDLLSITLPAETRMKEEENRIKQMEQEIKEKAEREAREKLNSRIEQLAQYGKTCDAFTLQHMPDEEFLGLVSSAKTEFDAYQEQKAKEEEERKKFEQEKLALEEEKRKLEEEKAKIQREEELKKAREDAAEKARIETEERLKREADTKAQEEARIEKAKKEAQDAIEAENAFKDWLTECGVTTENKADFKIIKEGDDSVLYKRVSSYRSHA